MFGGADFDVEESLMAGVMMTEVMAINGDVIFFSSTHIILTAIVLGGKVSPLMASE